VCAALFHVGFFIFTRSYVDSSLIDMAKEIVGDFRAALFYRDGFELTGSLLGCVAWLIRAIVSLAFISATWPISIPYMLSKAYRP